MATAAGTRIVRVDAGVPSPAPPDLAPGAAASDVAANDGGGRATFTLSPDPTVEWQDGLDRLADPASIPPLLDVSPPLPAVRPLRPGGCSSPSPSPSPSELPFVSAALDHLFFSHPAPSRAISRAHAAAWGARLLFAALVSVVEIVILAVRARLSWPARRGGRSGGGRLDGLFDDVVARTGGATANDDGARRRPGPWAVGGSPAS